MLLLVHFFKCLMLNFQPLAPFKFDHNRGPGPRNFPYISHMVNAVKKCCLGGSEEPESELFFPFFSYNSQTLGKRCKHNKLSPLEKCDNDFRRQHHFDIWKRAGTTGPNLSRTVGSRQKSLRD